jgi:hypothetical protein
MGDETAARYPEEGATKMSCPICSTENGRLLREALGDVPVGVPLLATLLPFFVCAILVASIKWLFADTVHDRALEAAASRRGNDEPAS